MDKQEAVQKLSKIARISMSYAEDLYDSFFEKPVVPQFVADWYEKNKDELEEKIYQEVCRAEKNFEEGCLTDFQEWMIGSGKKPFETLVNMNQFGYEVEKEARYRVKIKGTGQYLTNDGSWPHFNLNFKTDFTKSELESLGLGWVIDCEGIEIKEVE